MGRSLAAVAADVSVIFPRGPGSNGYWRRQLWSQPGAYSFTVKKTGKIKIAAMGPGSGANRYPGAGGGLSIKELDVVEGDEILVTVGAGSIGAVSSAAVLAGGTTTVTCAARALSMIVNGGGAHTDNTAVGGTASGGDLNFKGGDAPYINYIGGASSGRPFADGVSSMIGMRGGLGWATAPDFVLHNVLGGSGSHYFPPAGFYAGGGGMISRGGEGIRSNAIDPSTGLNGEAQEWWDLDDVDGGGGGARYGGDVDCGSGGPGGGGAGAEDSTRAGNGGFGAGGGGSTSGVGGNGGNGAGGGGSSTSYTGGNGGNGFVGIWWDEVAA